MGIVLAAWFAAGVALLAYIQERPDASQAGLDSFIFGQAAAMVERAAVAVPTGELGQPADVADGVLFLASDEASYITGQSLVVDGGYTAGHSHGIVELLGLV